ncbi:hypothetical protein SZ64_02775 [Erythrobacter sp. SG61-1L]|uniref:hypothetical protein n=1 Tax=Erythrobacter sp. SG61-1L TaxID=1603897 RepID=UPI0006C90E0E|nr:hypothetical protein [Erythrobacter sp. SG61-1L]KPL67113.1 hypothetical protein SZ64_02775 [Erythrobacter sp. SG61-1L]
MKSLHLLALAAFAVTSLPAHAEEAGPVTSFRIGLEQLEMPIPQGYCLPQGNEEAASQLLAAADYDNVTLAHFHACGRNPAVSAYDDYILLKTPKAVLALTLPREEFLDVLDAESNKPGANIFDAAMRAQVEAEMGEVMGTAPKLAFEIEYLGRDEDCVYLIGHGDVSIDDVQTKRGLMVACMAVTQGKMFAVYSYRFAAGDTVEGLKAQTRAIAVSVRAKAE